MKTTEQFSTKVNYVSPGIKVTQLRARRVLCQSPEYGDVGEAGAKGFWEEDEEDY